jgi:hypothetical protein
MRYLLVLAVLSLMGCPKPAPTPTPDKQDSRWCGIIKYEGEHFKAILSKKSNQFKLLQVCGTESVDQVLNQSCADGTHMVDGVQTSNRRYLEAYDSSSNEYGWLWEHCWGNCDKTGPERQACEYPYPKGCSTAKKLVGSDPCRAYGDL